MDKYIVQVNIGPEEIRDGVSRIGRVEKYLRVYPWMLALPKRGDFFSLTANMNGPVCEVRHVLWQEGVPIVSLLNFITANNDSEFGHDKVIAKLLDCGWEPSRNGATGAAMVAAILTGLLLEG